MVLDEPSADDEIIKESGITFAINKQLLEEAKPVQLDYIQNDRGSGYRISSSMSGQKSCGSCSC